MNFLKFQLEVDGDLVWRLMLSLCTIALVFNISESAFAASNDVIGMTLCRLVQNLTGGIARGIATIAIFAVGVGLFLGKLNWGIAAATAVGVGTIFSAPKLVAFLSGDANNSSCPTA